MNCYHCGSRISVYRFNRNRHRVEPFCESCQSYIQLPADPTGISCSGCNLDFTTTRFLERFGCERCYETFRPPNLQTVDFDEFQFPNINPIMQENRKVIDQIINHGFQTIETQNIKTEWLPIEIQPDQNQIIVRIRVARNFVGLPYLSRMAQIEKNRLQSYLVSKQGKVVKFIESQLESDDGFAKNTDIQILNDEDHLRITFFRRFNRESVDFSQIYEFQNQVSPIIKNLDSTFLFQYHALFGYLTACPSNSGSGIRCSVRIPNVRPGFTIDQLSFLEQHQIQIRGSTGEGSKAKKSVTFLFKSGKMNGRDFKFVLDLTLVS